MYEGSYSPEAGCVSVVLGISVQASPSALRSQKKDNVPDKPTPPVIFVIRVATPPSQVYWPSKSFGKLTPDPTVKRAAFVNAVPQLLVYTALYLFPLSVFPG